MRIQKRRLWILAAFVVLGAAAWLVAGYSPASATVITVADPSSELTLFQDAAATSVGYNCNLTCPATPGPCLSSNCGESDKRCACHQCPGGIKCTRELAGSGRRPGAGPPFGSVRP